MEQITAYSLTEREKEVVAYLADGLSNREIAERMVVALSTVKWHTRQIFNKLGVDGREEAVERARTLGFLLKTEDALLIGNLPAQLSSFVGRESEIAEIGRLLQSARLITLTGAGGSGKTRLALRVVALRADDYLDGVAYVSLAPVRDAQLVPNAIAHALGVREQPSRPLVESLKRYFADKKMLLLLDNFEHLLVAAPVVAEILKAAPHLVVLVTSREALHISGEHEFLVPPLALPDSDSNVTATDLMQVESVALFVQRAQMVSREFRLTGKNAPAVASICLRLDGLPLAIELAAARIRLFGPQQLLDRLQSRLGLLVGGPRDLPDRQRTLRDTIEWSYNLLTNKEQALFSSLAVFNGGRTLEGVEAVCGFEGCYPLIANLESLLSKNLIYQQEGSDGLPRFFMLETVHEYAHEQLLGSGRLELTRDRHLAYYLELCESMAPGYLQGGQLALFRRTDAEMANIRAAFEWAIQSEQYEKAARLITAVNYFLRYFTESIVEGYQLNRGLLPYLEKLSPSTRILFLIGASELAFNNNDLEPYRALSHQALSEARELGVKELLAWTLIQVVDFTGDKQDYCRSIEAGKEALSLFRELDQKPGAAYVLNRLGEVYRLGGEPEQARIVYEEALALCRETGEILRASMLEGNLGLLAYKEGNYEEALAHYLPWLRVPELRGIAHATVTALSELAAPIAQLGEPEKAARMLGASARLMSELGLEFHPYDKAEIELYEEDVRALLGEAAYRSAWQEGQQMSFEEIFEYALSDYL